MAGVSSRDPSPDRPRSTSSRRSDSLGLQDGRTTRMTIQTSAIRQSYVQHNNNATASTSHQTLHPSAAASAAHPTARDDLSSSTTSLLRPPVGLGRSIFTPTNTAPRVHMPEPPIAFLAPDGQERATHHPRKGKEREETQQTATPTSNAHGREKERRKETSHGSASQPANGGDTHRERGRETEKVRERTSTGEAAKSKCADKGKEKEKKKAFVPRMDPLCAPNAPYLHQMQKGPPEGAISFRVQGYNEVPTGAAEPASVPRDGPYEAMYRIPPAAPELAPAPSQPHHNDPGQQKRTYYRRDYEKERLNTPARRAKMQAASQAQGRQPASGSVDPTGTAAHSSAPTMITSPAEGSMSAPVSARAQAPTAHPTPPTSAHSPDPSFETASPSFYDSSEAYPTAHSPAPARRPPSKHVVPQYSQRNTSDYPDDSGAFEDLPPPLPPLKKHSASKSKRKHERQSRHDPPYPRDQYDYPPPPEPYPPDDEPVPVSAPAGRDSYSDRPRYDSRSQHRRREPSPEVKPRYHHQERIEPPPPHEPSVPGPPTVPFPPAAVLPPPQHLTVLIEDKRVDPPENQLADLMVQLKSEGGTWWVDAKELSEQLQGSASRIDGSVKAYTMRGKYKQYFLRLTPDGEIISSPINLSVSRELSLEIFLEELPYDGGKGLPAPLARAERSLPTPSTEPRTSVSPVARPRPMHVQERVAPVRYEHAYDTKPRTESLKRQYSEESISYRQRYDLPPMYSPTASQSSYSRPRSPDTRGGSYSKRYSPDDYRDHSPAYPPSTHDAPRGREVREPTRHYHGSSQSTHHRPASDPSRRLAVSYPSHERYTPDAPPSPYPPPSATFYETSPASRTRFPRDSSYPVTMTSPEPQPTNMQVDDPPSPSQSPSPTPFYEEPQNDRPPSRSPPPPPPPQGAWGFNKYASAYTSQQSSHAPMTEPTSNRPPKKAKMDTKMSAPQGRDARDGPHTQYEGAPRHGITGFAPSRRITSFHVSEHLDTSTTPLADAAGAPHLREMRRASPMLSRAPFPSAAQSEVDVAVATFIKGIVSKDPQWNDFARKRNSILSMVEQLDQYRYMRCLFDDFEGKRTPYELRGAPGVEISKVHVLRAFNLPPEWGENCLEMLQLVGMYGPSGSCGEDPEVVHMLNEVPPISTGIQVKKFLSLLRSVHARRLGAH